MNAREAAVSTLLKTAQSRGYSNIELDSAIKKFGLDGVEKSFFTALFYGVIERKITLDYIISSLSERTIGDIDIKVLTITELGLYQLRFMDKIPESAAVNESVKLCERFSAPKNSGAFVNAVLRRYIREKDSIKFPDPKRNKMKYLSVMYSVPEWICRLWSDAYGKNEEKILESLSKPPFMTLRVNTLKTTNEELRALIESKGIGTKEPELAKTGIRLSSSAPMDVLSEYEDRFFVQDEASQAAVLALGVREGDTVIDCCSCPGGKAMGAAIEAKNKGRVLSFDLHKNKLSLIEKTASRLGIGIISTDVQNGSKPRESMPGADRIICDVPCSGLGVISKKPDIRYKEYDEIKDLPSLQYSILETNSAYLKTGGMLVYSTCTLNPKENGDVIKRFLENHKNFRLCPFDVGPLHSEGMTELMPYEYKTDGFFIAKLEKAGD